MFKAIFVTYLYLLFIKYYFQNLFIITNYEIDGVL